MCYSVSTTEYVSIFSRLSAQCSSSIVHKIHALLSPYMCRLVSDVICSPCHQLIATIHTCEQDLWHATRAFILKVHTPADDRQKKLNVKKPIQPCKKPQKQNSRKVRIGGRNLNTVKRIDKVSFNQTIFNIYFIYSGVFSKKIFAISIYYSS